MQPPRPPPMQSATAPHAHQLPHRPPAPPQQQQPAPTQQHLPSHLPPSYAASPNPALRPPAASPAGNPVANHPPYAPSPSQHAMLRRPIQPNRPMPPMPSAAAQSPQSHALADQMRSMSLRPPPVNGHAHPGQPQPNPNPQLARSPRSQYAPQQPPTSPRYPLLPARPPPQQPLQSPAQPAQYASPHARAPVRPTSMRPTSMRPNPVAPPNPSYPSPYPSLNPANGYPSAQQPGQLPPPQRPGAPAPAPAPQPKLESSMVPRPCTLEKECGAPRPYYHRAMFQETDGAAFPYIPSSNSDFISIDDGSARLRFFRLTANSIASDPNLMTKSGVPLAAVMTPFADPAPGEAAVPLVDFSSQQIGGPLRCDRCNAYANPGFKFLSGGSQFQCNLCNHINTTPTEHFSPISPATGLRMDSDQRHELRLGSVDYIVGSPDYCIRPPKPACYLFAVDVSAPAKSSGLAVSALLSIKSAVSAGLLPGSAGGARIAIMTFDRALHFFDARGAETGKAVTMQYVPDVMDPFVPIGGNALFLTPEQAVHAIDAAMDIHSLSPKSQQQDHAPNVREVASPESALGSALQAVKQAFLDCGGKAFVVAGSLPNSGIGKLERRGGGAVGGGEDREMGLLKAASSTYDILGCELAEAQASVDLFLAPSSVYIDAATLSRVPRNCGGRMHLFPAFDPVRDGASLHRSICASAGQPRAFEALMRVRTSPGLEARGEFLGNFGRPQRGDDVAGPVFDSSTTLALELSVVSKLVDDKQKDGRSYSGSQSLYDEACVQCAILYTDSIGRRCIRVHTAFALKSETLSEVFRRADVDATACFLAKKASAAVLYGGTTFSKACEALTEKVAQTFYAYRKHCTNSSLSGQLILPEALKTLPIMILGLMKSSAFRKSSLSVQSGDAVTVDERASALAFLSNGRVDEVAAMCYPRMLDIGNMVNAAGIPLPPPTDLVVSGIDSDSKDRKSSEPIALPNTLLLSAECLTEKRILLIENAMHIVVWLGSQVERSVGDDIIVQSSTGRICIRGETAGSANLTKDVSEHGKRVARVIQRIVSQRRGLARPQVVVRSAPGAGGEGKYVIPLLVEDRNSGSYSYIEYLKHIHKRVSDKMVSDSVQSDMQTWEMLNHGY